MTVSPELVSMPRELLDKITKEFNLETVQSFRKTCRRHRNYIETVEIDPQIRRIQIIPEADIHQITIRLYALGSRNRIISYQKYRKGCHLKIDDERKFLRKADYATVAGNDLGLILRHQTREIDEISMFNLKCPDVMPKRFWNSLEPHLQRRTSLLQCHKIWVHNMANDEQYMKILTYLEPGVLRSIWMGTVGEPLKMDRIVQTEQWRQLDKVYLNGFKAVTSLANFHHIRDAKFEINRVSTQDLVILKDKLIRHEFEHFVTYFDYNRLTYVKEFLKAFEPWCTGTIGGEQRWTIPFVDGTKRLDIARDIKNRTLSFYSL